MRDRGKKERKFWQDARGFTLVELIITIAVLAVVTIPILSYFTDAAKHNANSRMKQNASVLAQDILEEFKNSTYSLDNPAVVCSAKPEWSISSPADADGVYELSTNVTMDKNSYQAKAKITPIKEVSKSAPLTSKEYKDFVIGTMDSAKDIMASEHGQTLLSAGLSFAGYHSNACSAVGTTPTMTAEQFQNNLDCTIIISAETNPDKAGYDIFRVKYRYTYRGGSYPKGITAGSKYEEIVQTSSIDVSKLENIYIFYSPSTAMGAADTIAFEVNDGGNLAANAGDLNLFVIAQSSVPNGTSTTDIPTGYTVRAPGYKLNFSSSMSGANDFEDKIKKLYLNLSSANGELGSGTVAGKAQTNSAGEYTLVHSEDINRLADITVTLTRAAGSVNAGKQVVEVHGSKIQN